MRTLLCSIMLPLPAFSEGLGQEFVVLEAYETVVVEGEMSPPEKLEIYIVPTEEGGFFQGRCYGDTLDQCSTFQFGPYPLMVRYDSADFTNAKQPDTSLMGDVTILEWQGDDVFPLQDGAEFAWVEQWRGAEFEADYRMSLETRCCVRPAYGSVAVSEQLWELDYRWTSFGDVGAPEEGQIISLYDPELGLIVRETQTSWSGTSDNLFTLGTVITGITRPE